MVLLGFRPAVLPGTGALCPAVALPLLPRIVARAGKYLFSVRGDVLRVHRDGGAALRALLERARHLARDRAHRELPTALERRLGPLEVAHEDRLAKQRAVVADHALRLYSSDGEDVPVLVERALADARPVVGHGHALVAALVRQEADEVDAVDLGPAVVGRQSGIAFGRVLNADVIPLLAELAEAALEAAARVRVPRPALAAPVLQVGGALLEGLLRAADDRAVHPVCPAAEPAPAQARDLLGRQDELVVGEADPFSTSSTLDSSATPREAATPTELR